MMNYQATITLTDGSTRTTVLAYNADLSIAQVRAAVKRRCRTTHGRRLASVAVRLLGDSGLPNQRGMV